MKCGLVSKNVVDLVFNNVVIHTSSAAYRMRFPIISAVEAKVVFSER